jgi:hypothetical protein
MAAVDMSDVETAKRQLSPFFPRRCGLDMAVIVLAALCVAGCGGREAAQVSGRVQYKGGEPITGGIRVIRFEPTPDSTATVRKAASSNIEQDGSFTLFTRKPGDGVYLGKYAVTFTVLSSATGGQLLIKPEYVAPDQTPFEIEVTEDMSGLLFELDPK